MKFFKSFALIIGYILATTCVASGQLEYNSMTDLLQGIFNGSFALGIAETIASTIAYAIEYPPFAETIQIYCANSTAKVFQEVFQQDPNIDQILDFTKETGFVTHGWNDDALSYWIVSLGDDWVKYRDMNLCRVSWSRLSHAGYVLAALRNTRIAARYISEFITDLGDRFNVQPENITLVGHSLGSHVMGFVGHSFSGRMKMIVGLDAAGPIFTIPIPLPFDFRLDSTDAQQVMLIHSGDFVTGNTIPSGHQDFYGNDGAAPQLGCMWPKYYPAYKTDPVSCSHGRAIDFFQSSLKPNSLCRAIRCNDRFEYFLRMCRSNVTNMLGLDATPGVNGKFFFATYGLPDCSGAYYN